MHVGQHHVTDLHYWQRLCARRHLNARINNRDTSNSSSSLRREVPEHTARMYMNALHAWPAEANSKLSYHRLPTPARFNIHGCTTTRACRNRLGPAAPRNSSPLLGAPKLLAAVNSRPAYCPARVALVLYRPPLPLPYPCADAPCDGISYTVSSTP